MCNAEAFLRCKGNAIAKLPPQATVLEAAKLMNEWHIGSVLVMDRDQLLGIFTERDVLRRVVGAHRNPETTRLDEVMTSPVACAAPHTTLDELRMVMRAQRIRHIPVAQNERVIGIISIGDLNKAEHEVQEQTILYLAQYMSVL